jgi:hypothetical protein
MPTDPGDIVILLQKAHDEGENSHPLQAQHALKDIFAGSRK